MEIYVEQIKNYSIELAEAVNRLLKQLNETAITLDKRHIEDIIASSANRLFVARKKNNKEIVGMLTLIVFRIPYAKKGLFEDVVVDEKYRGKGVGTKLISYAIGQARKEGITYLTFTSNPKRVAANRLYQHLGFKKRDTNVYRIEL